MAENDIDYYETPDNLKLKWDNTTDSLIVEVLDVKPNGVRFFQIDLLTDGSWCHAPSGVEGTLPQVLEGIAWRPAQ